MVFQSTIKEEKQVVPLSAHAADDDDDLSSSLSPLPSLELEASSSSSDDNDTPIPPTLKKDVSASSSNNVISPSSMRCKSDTASSKKKNQPPAKASSWWDSMLLNDGYSFISQLTIVLVVILSWYFAHRSAVNIWQTDDMMEYEYEEEEEYEEEDLSPWDIWGQGFDFDKQRDYWIADEDLPEDIAADLQSTNIAIQDEALARRQLDPTKWDTFGYWEIYHYLHVTRYLPRVGQFGVSNFLEMYGIFIMILKSRMVVVPLLLLLLLLLLLMGQLLSHQRIRQLMKCMTWVKMPSHIKVEVARAEG